jgi:predicted nucleic acid-binding protein
MLLDTSGLLCYFDLTDLQHSDAVTYFNSARERITHSYMLAEFVPCAKRAGCRVPPR